MISLEMPSYRTHPRDWIVSAHVTALLGASERIGHKGANLLSLLRTNVILLSTTLPHCNRPGSTSLPLMAMVVSRKRHSTDEEEFTRQQRRRVNLDNTSSAVGGILVSISATFTEDAHPTPIRLLLPPISTSRARSLSTLRDTSQTFLWDFIGESPK